MFEIKLPRIALASGPRRGFGGFRCGLRGRFRRSLGLALCGLGGGLAFALLSFRCSFRLTLLGFRRSLRLLFERELASLFAQALNDLSQFLVGVLLSENVTGEEFRYRVHGFASTFSSSACSDATSG